MTTNPCPHTPTHWPYNMIACDTTNGLRQVRNILDALVTECHNHVVRGDSTDFILSEIKEAERLIEAHYDAQKQRWEAIARLEGAKFVEERLRAAPKDSWYGTLSEAIAALDGVIGEQTND